jgi:molecular chaperone HtpG
MIHSVYSNKDIFLRELISNSSDAIDKLRYEALTDTDLARFAVNPEIRLEPDPDARTLVVSDTGIGMTRDEVIRFIGTIAKSGTREFAHLVQEAKASGKDVPADLIGQFGVGFYSSFMVADKVSLVTRRAGEDTATTWESTGDGKYTLGEGTREVPGTTVTLHLKPADEENGLHDYTKEYTLRDIVKHYSDFVAYPIKMRTERTEIQRDEEGNAIEGAEPKKVVEDQTLNSQKAIWTRPEKDVTDEEFNEFYKHISHDWNEPLKRISVRAEGTSEFRALLFIPSKAPFNLFSREYDPGIHLYIRRVFIMSDAKDLLPEYLRFVKGVVDSEDLSLNVSREILQKDRQINIIRKALVKKVLDALKAMRSAEPEKFKTFQQEFGRVIKEGLFNDDTRDSLLEVCEFASIQGEEKREAITLAEYVSRMKPDQNAIYYITGPSAEAVEASPHLEAFRAKGYEVLILSDPVDEVWTQYVHEFEGKRLQSAAKGAATLGTEEERKQDEEKLKEKQENYSSLMDALKGKLGEHVKEVRLSTRLTSSPACLVGDTFDMSPQLLELMRASGQDVPEQKRILELNPNHPLLEKLQSIFAANPDDARLANYADLLYGQSVLAEGGKLPDPGAFSKKVADLMAEAIK